MPLRRFAGRTLRQAVNTAYCTSHDGPTWRVSGTRELVVHRNYLLVYDLTGDMVRVIRILHAAQQWPPSNVQPVS